MDPFTINIKESAEKKLLKYDKETQRRFATKIRKLKENPELHGKPLRKPLHGYWEIYFEKRFRIIYSIDFNTQIVTIEAIWHKDDF
ncbi:MAG: type II toxin-antitoxin system RelE/ParE family toxin [Methanoregula sp.]